MVLTWTRYRDRGLALASLVLLGMSACIGGPDISIARIGITLMAILIAFLSNRWSTCAAKQVTLLVACLLLASSSGALLWQALMAAALILYWLVRRFVPGQEPLGPRIGRGQVPVALTALAGLVTPIALGTWVVWLEPDLSDVVKVYVPDLPLPLLIVGAAAFAVVNAVLEETIWRWLIQDCVQALFSSVTMAVIVQAISFGIQHANGVPRGLIGIAMAGVWALLLGILRHQAKGLLAPTIAHIVADTAIATIILTIYR